MTRGDITGAISWSRARVPRILSVIAKVLLVLGVVGYLRDSGAFILLWALSLAALVLSYARSLTLDNQAGEVELRAREIVITYGSYQEVIPIEKVVCALLVDRRDSFGNTFTTVELDFASGDRVTFTARSPEHARAIVEHAGFGRHGRRQRATFVKPTRRLFHPLIFAAFYAVCSRFSDIWGASILAPVVALAFYELASRALRAPELVAGSDGLLVRRAFGTTFYPRRDISTLEAQPSGALVIVGRGGRRTVLRGLDRDAARLAAFVRELQGRGDRGETTGSDASVFARHDLPLDDWRRRLQSRPLQTDYRTRPESADEALAVVESAEASPDERVGAALTARSLGVPAERIRVAADATVDDRVRVALEAVADDADDATLERALRRLSR
ncbi:MAG: PH domain-containing protein [Deltaproteobacteria bacterium]|nr:PH domain-containing protein [Deltaproteobacteria bacterium]